MLVCLFVLAIVVRQGRRSIRRRGGGVHGRQGSGVDKGGGERGLMREVCHICLPYDVGM